MKYQKPKKTYGTGWTVKGYLQYPSKNHASGQKKTYKQRYAR